MTRILLLISGIFFLSLLIGCDESSSSLAPYEQRILQSRFEKDLLFRDPKRSPLKPSDLKRFPGIRYFPVDSSYRFILPLKPLDPPETTWVINGAGGREPYLKIGYIEWVMHNTPLRLAVFKPAGDTEENTVWIPFTDQTTGKETYGGGRYLDAPIQDDGMILVDFNLAYNPLCAYNPAFICALPPAENRLPVAIRAGEMQSPLYDEP